MWVVCTTCNTKAKSWISLKIKEEKKINWGKGILVYLIHYRTKLTSFSLKTKKNCFKYKQYATHIIYLYENKYNYNLLTYMEGEHKSLYNCKWQFQPHSFLTELNKLHKIFYL